MVDYNDWVGRKVCKKSGHPFKSGLKIGTVIKVVTNPFLEQKGKIDPAFMFQEDGSIVSCRTCKLVEETVPNE